MGGKKPTTTVVEWTDQEETQTFQDDENILYLDAWWVIQVYAVVKTL